MRRSGVRSPSAPPSPPDLTVQRQWADTQAVQPNGNSSALSGLLGHAWVARSRLSVLFAVGRHQQHCRRRKGRSRGCSASIRNLRKAAGFGCNQAKRSIPGADASAHQKRAQAGYEGLAPTHPGDAELTDTPGGQLGSLVWRCTRRFFCTLPMVLRGSSLMKCSSRGSLKRASRWPSAASRAWASGAAPGRGTT